MKVLTGKRVNGFLVNLAALLVILYVVGPFLWVAIASFQGENELLRKPPSFIPQNPTLDNYNYVFTGKIPTAYEVKGQLRSRISQEARLIAPALKNSFIVALVVAAVNLSLGSLAAYTFARLRFRLKTLSYNFILGSRLVPAMAVAIPYYVIVQTLGLLDTYWSMVLVYMALTLPFTIWFLTLYITNVPREMEEAALIDGCTRFGALTRVVVPMALPGLVAAAAFSFMSSYNEFLFARFLTQSIKSQTGPVIIASVAGNPDASYSLISVCVTLALIPPLILALVLRRWLTEGLSASVTYR
ncbi:MAG: carbohydrate ABC transporter permease [Anaerolineae bacterium]